MKAIAINGSPRAGGNTEIMLKKVLEPLEAAGWSTEYRQIGGKPVRGCLACGKCIERRNGRCIIESDVINEYLELMSAADAIILGSPTYFADVTAEMKALIDRAGFVALANGGAFSGKIGGRGGGGPARRRNPCFRHHQSHVPHFLHDSSPDPCTGTWAWVSTKEMYWVTKRPCGT